MRRVILIGVLLLSACGGGSPPNTVPGTEVYQGGDAVQALLRDRVRRTFPGSDDFQVIVTEVGYPIGALMPEGRTVAVSVDACKPSFDAGSYPMPSAFPAINMTGKAAFDLGVDSAAVAQLAQFGVKAGQDDTFKLAVSGAAGHFLVTDQLQRVLAQPACAAALRGQSLILVRGYVVGKRNFLLQRDRNAGINIGVTKIGSLKVDASRSGSVSLEDEQPTEFLQIVSKVSLPATAMLASVNIPTVPAGAGKVYLQRDVSDATNSAATLKGLLTAQSFNVVPQVEAIASSKVPRTAQVRYFSKSDEGAADRALSVLRQVYPTAAKLFVGLQAPAGQLEVWLPRAGS